MKQVFRKALTVFIFISVVLIIISGIYWIHRIEKKYGGDAISRVDYDAVSKVMIVAHPDDETIWGGGHLTDGGYLVVCLTGGNNETRALEFRKAVTAADKSNIPLILNYPDKTFFVRDNWYGLSHKIENDIYRILRAKTWDIIVTHNPSGEYGHIHHKNTSKLVSHVFGRIGSDSELFFFGTYHSKRKINKYLDKMVPLEKEKYDKKLECLKIYESQGDVIKNLSHMAPYENWYKYKKH